MIESGEGLAHNLYQRVGLVYSVASVRSTSGRRRRKRDVPVNCSSLIDQLTKLNRYSGIIELCNIGEILSSSYCKLILNYYLISKNTQRSFSKASRGYYHTTMSGLLHPRYKIINYKKIFLNILRI